MATFLSFCVLLAAFSNAVIWVEADKAELRTLRRQKREWIVPPKKLLENVDYTRDEFIAKIRSDEETRTDIEYSLIGDAVNEGLFGVDRKTGYVKIYRLLDREKVDHYDLKGRATLRNGSLAERDLDLKIIVLDQNDNPPVFNIKVIGSVEELSDRGTHVIAITAIDADEAGTAHSQIAYSIIQQGLSSDMFSIEESSGEIKVRMNTLDRETQDTYTLIITGTDMNGKMTDPKNKPLTGTGTVTIKVRDVNDNIPVLEKNYYEGSVEENTMHVEAIRIKAIDMDQIHTENWEAVYTIISGNEAGYFNITTDPNTNEGIIMVTKELDYEQIKEVNLKVAVRNKATYHKSVVIDKSISYPIKIKVVNVPEAPHFQPSVKVVSISEDHTTIDLRKVITTYTATDSDTLLTATNVRYLKREDVDNWLNINEQTAEIRLNKYPDRESKFLINGTYYAKIVCITNDLQPKTATGTIAIQVQDFNDHCPILTSSVTTVCYGSSVVYVTASDGDKFPNAEPFEFRVITERTKENWRIEHLNETSVILRSQEILWPGYYTVELDVQDQQGKSCEVPARLQVSVCTCTEEQVCRPGKQTSTKTILGGGGVIALLLGIVLLLLIPVLLLFCNCGGGAGYGNFQAFPFDTKEHLMTYHTEGQGEDKQLAVLSQTQTQTQRTDEYWLKYGFKSEEEYLEFWRQRRYESGFDWDNFYTGSAYDYMALSETYLASYYGKKVLEVSKQEASTNYVLVSDYEKSDSISGSLEDICSHLQEDNLDFLDDLGPQFKRLAEICYGSTIKQEISSITKPSKTILFGSEVEKEVESGVQKEVTSVSTASSSSTTQITNTNYEESINSGGTATAATIGQTLLVQRPTVYLTSTPMYVVEQQRSPTLFLASGSVLGLQERKVLLVEKGGTNVAVSTQNTLPNLGLKHTHAKVLVDPGTVVHGFSGQPEPNGIVSGTVRVVESQRIESTEPVHVVQSSSHSSFSESQSMQTRGESRGFMSRGSAPVSPSALSVSHQDASLFALPNDGTHHAVREEKVTVVEKSFQSSSTS